MNASPEMKTRRILLKIPINWVSLHFKPAQAYWLFFQLRASNRPLPPRWANYRHGQRGLETATVTQLKQRSMSAVRMLSPSMLTAGRCCVEEKIQLCEWGNICDMAVESQIG